MKKFLALPTVLLALTVFAASAHSQKPCPVSVTKVEAPYDVKVGQPLVFTATIVTVDPSFKPTYHWSVSAGEVKTGQGTLSITVDTTELGGFNVGATFQLTNLPPECPVTKSAMSEVIGPQPARLRHQYPAPWPANEADQMTRFAKYFNMVERHNNSLLHVIYYSGKTAKAADAAADKDRILKLAVASGFTPDRVLWVDGGKRDRTFVEYWSVPSGATPPKPSKVERYTAPKAEFLDSIPGKGGDIIMKLILIEKKVHYMSTTYIIFKRPSNMPDKEAQDKMNTLKQLLSQVGLSSERYLIIEKLNSAEYSIDFWLVPLGAEVPN